MCKGIIILTAWLLMGASARAVVPASMVVDVDQYTNPSSSTTRTNVAFAFRDAGSVQIEEPGSVIRVLLMFENNPGCGRASTTATVVAHNGISLVMKKGLFYTLIAPVVHTHMSVDINARINHKDFFGKGKCFSINAFVPGSGELLSPY